MHKISIIIAMYNTEKYIEETIESIINQPLKEVQIIIIDDESTDDSVVKVRTLQKKYPNIELYCQQNQGPAIARNNGMTKASGKYIMFLDSDDLLTENALQNLYNAIEKHGSDVVAGTIRSFSQSNRGGWYHNFIKPFVGLEFYNKSLDDVPKLITSLSTVNKIYLRSFLSQNSIRFYENVHLREDAYFMAEVFVSTEKISHIPFDVYLYRIREKNDTSLTHTVNPKVFEDIIFISEQIDNVLATKTFNNREKIDRERYITELIAINFRLNSYILEDHPDLERVMQKIHDYLQKIDDEIISVFSFKNRLVLFSLKHAQYHLAKKINVKGDSLTIFDNDIFKSDQAIVEIFLREQYREIQALRKSKKPSALSLREQLKNLKSHIKIKSLRESKTFLRRSYFYVIGRIANFKAKDSDIWLVGERLGAAAQDTGYHFFRYCREYYPTKEIYFVTKKENITPELLKIGNIIEFGTIKHHVYLLASKVHIYNDSYRDICTKWESVRKTRHVKVVCFLQHGIIALSKMHGHYDHKNMMKRAENIDIFITSSTFEKNIIVESMGHIKENVLITGLPRFDNLYKHRHIRNKKIVYIPTWRNWLRYSTEKEFLDSEYYKETLNVIKTLTKLQQQYSFEFEVCIHHALAKFTHLYESDNKINFVDMSTVNVQDMIINAGMLVTDYSSISFDFAFLEKPVIFYQFDREKFLEVRHGAFIDYKTELFGPVIEDLTSLSNSIKRYIDNSYQMNHEDKHKAKRYFAYHDAKNSERIFNAINKKLKEKSL